MSNVKVVLNYAGFNALRKSGAMYSLVQEKANEQLRRLGDGYAMEMRQSGTRCVAKVYPVSQEADHETYQNNSLLKR